MFLSCSNARPELRAAPAAPRLSPPPHREQGGFIGHRADKRPAELLGRKQDQSPGRDRIRAGLRACDR